MQRRIAQRIAKAAAVCRFDLADVNSATKQSETHRKDDQKFLDTIAASYIKQWEHCGQRVLRVRARRTSAPHTASVIFSHGLGDTGEGWAWSFVEMAERMPHVEFLFPTARVVPVSCNYGAEMPSWYDIQGLDVDRLKMDAPGIHESSALIHSLVSREVIRIAATHPSASVGAADNDTEAIFTQSAKRVMVGGFSQGAALSMFSGHTFDAPLGGILALSGYCTQLHDLEAAAKDPAGAASSNLSTPLLMCHGEQDMVVPFALAQESFRWAAGSHLRGSDELMRFHPLRGVGHESSPEELQLVEAFIAKHLPSLKSSGTSSTL